MKWISRIKKYYECFKDELSNFFRSDIERVYSYLNKNSGIKMKPGDAIFFYKNPDDCNSQLLFGILEEVVGSDVIIRLKNKNVTLSKQRVYLYAPTDQ